MFIMIENLSDFDQEAFNANNCGISLLIEQPDQDSDGDDRHPKGNGHQVMPRLKPLVSVQAKSTITDLF